MLPASRRLLDSEDCADGPFGLPFVSVNPRIKRSLVARISSPRLSPGCIARFGLVIGRIKAGQLHAFLDLAKNPTFIQLMFGAFVSDEVDQILGNYHRTVVIHDNHVAGKHGATAAADRLLPTDEGQAIDGCRRSDAGTPDWKCTRQYTGAVAHNAVRDQRRDVALLHTRTKNVAEDSGARHGHYVRNRNYPLRHVLNCGARRDRARPALRCRQVLAHRHEPQRECWPNNPLTAEDKRFRAIHPAAPDALL